MANTTKEYTLTEENIEFTRHGVEVKCPSCQRTMNIEGILRKLDECKCGVTFTVTLEAEFPVGVAE